MSISVPEILKSLETTYLEKLNEYERTRDVYNKSQFDLLTAQDAMFIAFKKLSNAKEHFLVDLVNNRNTKTLPVSDEETASQHSKNEK
jgi:hypothetical protein